ncbi:MAG: UDP-glucose--hexose-1-phosphate uridylyltransferase [Chloroflexota bacterium]
MSDVIDPAALEAAHRRYNPLADEWVLVAAGRSQRPWQGSEEPPPAARQPRYDAACYLCPGNARASGDVNPTYTDSFVFTNDFAALSPEAGDAVREDGLLLAAAEAGTCHVICFSPRHDLSLGSMDIADVRRVVDVWAEETAALGELYRWVQVFENRGAAMGASNPHPHGQVWAGTALPTYAAREDATQRRHRSERGSSLLVDYLDQEADGPRVVTISELWAVVVPFWAVWPFETLILPRARSARLPDLSPAARDDLAATLLRLIAGYDRLFDRPFPYSMGWHQAPFPARGRGGAADEHWQLHGHVYPPLLRDSVRKFMVGYELLAEPQRDLTPEDAAARLRAAVERG